MKYAIIAAGEGSRLTAEGINEPKPLVCVGGEPLIDRLIRIFMDNGADEIVAICNDRTARVASHLLDIQRDGLRGRPVPLRFRVKSTPSSMHSFYEISQWLDGAPFCLTTVDTIFREDEFREYIICMRKAIESGEADGVMGTTDYIDDEKPLYVDVDANGRIKAFLDSSDVVRHVSAGIYGLSSLAIKTLRDCVDRGESRMRNFQRAILKDGYVLKAHNFTKVLDIDHASDIKKAEQFLLKGT